MNPQETIRERQTLFLRYKKPDSFRGRFRVGIFLWASLLALVLLLAPPHASFAQSALTDDANVGSDNLDHATVIGADAIVGSSNTVVLGRSADSVQIPGALM